MLAPILPPAIQRQLGLRDPRFRPLSDVRTVLRDLGEFEIDVAEIVQLLEQRLLLGFNIAVALDGRAEYRVLTQSIAHFRSCAGRTNHELPWPQIFAQVVPHTKPVVTGLEIRRALLCDRGHVENLVRARCLTALRKSQPGPGGSWVVSRDSFELWLKARML